MRTMYDNYYDIILLYCTPGEPLRKKDHTNFSNSEIV